MGSRIGASIIKSRDLRHSDGVIYARISYVGRKNMKREGISKFWYGNGQFRGREFYRDGKLEGERKFYTSSGLLITYSYHENGYDMDCDFTWQKKAKFCTLKRFLRSRINVPLINTLLISDLSQTVIC